MTSFGTVAMASITKCYFGLWTERFFVITLSKCLFGVRFYCFFVIFSTMREFHSKEKRHFEKCTQSDERVRTFFSSLWNFLPTINRINQNIILINDWLMLIEKFHKDFWIFMPPNRRFALFNFSCEEQLKFWTNFALWAKV